MEDDFSSIKSMKYRGRTIVVGTTSGGYPLVGYGLEGREKSSQARMLVYDKGSEVIRTQVTDEEELKNGSRSLLIYPAVAYVRDFRTIVASNGAQTKLLYREIGSDNRKPSRIIHDALSRTYFEYDEKGKRWVDLTSYEPDEPHFTSRIMGVVADRGAAVGIRANIEGGLYSKEKSLVGDHMGSPHSGLIGIVTTYDGENHNPQRPFFLRTGLPMPGRVRSESAQDIAESLYDAIRGPTEEDNFRVAAAVMVMGKDGLDVAVINRIERGN